MFRQFHSHDFELHVKSVSSPGAWEHLAERCWGPRGELLSCLCHFPTLLFSAPLPVMASHSPGLEGHRGKNVAKLFVFGTSLKVTLPSREVFRGSQRPPSAYFSSLCVALPPTPSFCILSTAAAAVPGLSLLGRLLKAVLSCRKNLPMARGDAAAPATTPAPRDGLSVCLPQA